jgi:hypothetical protein
MRKIPSPLHARTHTSVVKWHSRDIWINTYIMYCTTYMYVVDTIQRAYTFVLTLFHQICTPVAQLRSGQIRMSALVKLGHLPPIMLNLGGLRQNYTENKVCARWDVDDDITYIFKKYFEVPVSLKVGWGTNLLTVAANVVEGVAGGMDPGLPFKETSKPKMIPLQSSPLAFVALQAFCSGWVWLHFALLSNVLVNVL